MTIYNLGYTATIPVPDCLANAVVAALVKHVVTKFGLSHRQLSDGPIEYKNKSTVELKVMMQARQVHPVPYRSDTFKDMLAMYVTENQNDWDKWINYATYHIP